MSTLALAVGIGLWAHVAWRRDALAPAGLFILVCVAGMAAFHAVTALGWRPATMLTWWQIAGRYDPVADRVMLFYLGLATLGYLAWHAAAAAAPRAITPPAANESAAAAALASRPATAAWAALLALCAWHAAAIDWTPLLHSADHLEARRPAGVGLHNPLLATFHRNLPMIGCLLAPVVVLTARARALLPAACVAAAFAYTALVACGIGTRFLILQLALLTASLFVLRRPRAAILPAALSATATALTYLVFVATRRRKVYGLVPTLHTLATGDFLSRDLPLYVGISLFGGPFTVAEALLRGDARHPPAYKLLSFSPLPSAVDGFASIRDAAQVRILDRAPFSGIAEAYLFGPGYLLLLLAALFVSLVVLGLFWRRYRGAAAMLVLAPAIYALAAIHLYALRNTFRWLTLATLAAALALAVAAARRRLAPPAAVTFIGTLPPPVTGRTLATRHVIDAIARRAAVRVIDVSGGARRGVAFRLAKLGRTLAALLQLSLLPRAPGDALYLVANHGHGLWYDAALVAVGRVRGYRLFLHHQVYTYVAQRDARMALIHRLMRHTDCHVLLSDRMAEEFRARYPARRRYRVVSNAIVTLDLPPPPPRPDHPPTTLGHISNLTLEKGLDTVLETFDQLRRTRPDTRLLLAGPARGRAERELITRAAARCGDALEHRGPVYGDAKEHFFRDVDVLLLPTRYGNEAQPLVIAEALHHGAPVIAYGRGCIPEQVGQAGQVIPPAARFAEDAPAMVDAWRSDPAAWSEVRRRAASAGEAARTEAAGQLRRLVDDMLERPPDAAPVVVEAA